MKISIKDRNRLLNQLHKRHIYNSKRRRIETNIGIRLFTRLAISNCSYCGASPSNTFKYSGLVLKYSGIDRIDSSIGYAKNNVVPCCAFCNSVKGAMVPKMWFDFLKGVIRINGGIVPEKYNLYSDPGRPKKSIWRGR